MAGRPRKPTAVLEATGAFQKNPSRKRARANEPKVNGPIGSPPAYFDANHKAIWWEYVEHAAPGVLAKSDRFHLELTVRLTAKLRLVPGRMPKWLKFLGDFCVEQGMSELHAEEMKNAFRTAVGMSAQEESLLQTCLTRLGMNPADRSKVNADDEDEEEDDFAAAGPIQ